MKNKLLKRTLMLGALMGCMATAAWAGNVEVDWIGGNVAASVAQVADGYYITHQTYESKYSTADEGGTYQSYFDANGNERWGSYTYKNNNSVWRLDYDNDGNLVKYVDDAELDGHSEVTTMTFAYDNGILKQSRTYVNAKEQIDDSTYYYTYGDHKITVVAGYANEDGNQGDAARYEYTLDDNGNVIQSVVHSMVSGETHTTTYSYDAKGNLVEEKYDSGSYLYEYNDKDLCVKQTWKNSDGNIGTVTSYEYDANGNLVTESDSWSNTYRYTYALIPQGGSKSEFSDVPVTQFYNIPVIWATETGVTAGVGNNKFDPNSGCTRGQLVTFLWRAAGRPEPKTTKSPFTDVQNPNAYYYKAVLWAVENGITAGVGDNRFDPDATCTRAQIVTFIYRASGDKGTYTNNPFKDVPSSEFYYKPVMWAVANGITAGTSDTTFSPNATCTRAQGVSFLYRGVGLF